MKMYKQLRWVICMMFALSCARVTSPTGGPKDSIPPNLIQSNPTQGQTNFKGQGLELTFDEALVLNNAKDQIIITPGIGKDFEATLKKNKVTLTFDNPLQENTTYSVHFRESVQDITEKNPAQNIHLAFSTGTYIDSLSIDGHIYDLLTLSPIKDGTVALYETDTFNIFRHRPSYITRTDAKGRYELANLKPGRYNIYAIKDDNKNLIVDSRSEAYGFRAAALELTTNIKDINIALIRLDARPLKLTSARPSQAYFNIKLSKNLKEYRLSTEANETVYASFGPDQENIRVYNPGYITDSLLVSLHASDSMNNTLDTALYVKFSRRELKPELFQLTNNGFTASAINGTLKASFKMNKPLAAIDFDSLFYQIDSARIIPFTANHLTYDTIHNLVTLTQRIDKKLLSKEPVNPKTKTTKNNKAGGQRNFSFYAAKGTFLSIEGDSSKRFEAAAEPTTLDNSGMIIVKISTEEKKYIIDLISKDKIFATRYSTPSVTFEDLPPGDYRIRLTIDKNADGEWSPGNFFRHEEAEPAVFYLDETGNQTIRLKANFELGPLLIAY
jgi:uncharacterized protein (DUF2141 family)